MQIADTLNYLGADGKKIGLNIQHRHCFPPSVFSARLVEPTGVGSKVTEASCTHFQSWVLYTVSPSMPFEKAGPETFLSCPDTLQIQCLLLGVAVLKTSEETWVLNILFLPFLPWI